MRCTAFAVAFLISAFTQPAAWAQINFGHVFRNLSALSEADEQAEAQEDAVELEGEDNAAVSQPSEGLEAGAAELQLLEPGPEEDAATPPPPAEPAPAPESLNPLDRPTPDGVIPHAATPYQAHDAAIYDGGSTPQPPACGPGCSPAGLYYGYHPRPMTMNQLFSPPPHARGLWDTYPQEYLEAEEKRRAMQYRRPQPRWLGCNEDGIYIGPAPYSVSPRPCDAIAKKREKAASQANSRIVR